MKWVQDASRAGRITDTAGMLIGINVGLSLLAGSLMVRGVGPYLIETGIGREIVLNNISADKRSECEKLIATHGIKTP